MEKVLPCLYLITTDFMKRRRDSLRFLIIEDVKEHAQLILEAVHTHHFLHDISSVKNCDMAMQLLNEYEKEDYLPHIIILDLNVSGKNALDFLSTLHKDQSLAKIPVFALTPVAKEDDRQFISRFKNCLYIVKPAGIISFMELINFICNFWTEHKKAPDYQSIRKRIS